ncbi:hypothetical protein [uncultured Ligilactobacillus sp.]|uniref:hypothetical protein n=1 Tax=uncultured Ligilactobacillus sp. TaxID=2837633 RepID=UPI00272D2E6C|nr:hypothetical protein [uncultured Ligilactobacillus sp.]
MTKISVATKLKVIEEYANGTTSLATVRAKYKSAKLDSQIWGSMQDLVKKCDLPRHFFDRHIS